MQDITTDPMCGMILLCSMIVIILGVCIVMIHLCSWVLLQRSNPSHHHHHYGRHRHHHNNHDSFGKKNKRFAIFSNNVYFLSHNWNGIEDFSIKFLLGCIAGSSVAWVVIGMNSFDKSYTVLSGAMAVLTVFVKIACNI